MAIRVVRNVTLFAIGGILAFAAVGYLAISNRRGPPLGALVTKQPPLSEHIATDVASIAAVTIVVAILALARKKLRLGPAFLWGQATGLVAAIIAVLSDF